MSSEPSVARCTPFWSQPVVVACGWCRRVQQAAGDWGPPDPAGPGGDVTHTICPDCLKTRFAEWLDE